jgi:tetratricopeptide (TPR) repeat protein
MRKLDQRLDSTSVTHHIHYFQGSHQWPESSLCTTAWQWMELHSHQRGTSRLAEDTIESIYSQFLQRIKGREMAGDIFFATHEYRSLPGAFKGRPRLKAIKQKIQSLEKSALYIKFNKAEIKRAKQEDVYLRKAIGSFNRIKNAHPGEVKINRLNKWIGLAKLKSLAKKRDLFVQGFGRRILYNIANHAESEAKIQMKKKEFERALLFIKLAIAAGKEYYYHSSLLYNLSRIYAGKKRLKKAIETLEKVNEITPLDAEFLKKDPYMQNLLKESSFRQFIDSLVKEKNKKGLP